MNSVDSIVALRYLIANLTSASHDRRLRNDRTEIIDAFWHSDDKVSELRASTIVIYCTYKSAKYRNRIYMNGYRLKLLTKNREVVL